MNADQKKQPKEPLRIPLDFEETLEAMLQIKPEPTPDKNFESLVRQRAELVRERKNAKKAKK